MTRSEHFRSQGDEAVGRTDIALVDFAKRHALPLRPARGYYIVYLQNGFLSESELLPGSLLATITHARKFRYGKAVMLRLAGCDVEDPEDWEIQWWVNDDVFPSIRAHFNPGSAVQVRMVLKLLGKPEEG